MGGSAKTEANRVRRNTTYKVGEVVGTSKDVLVMPNTPYTGEGHEHVDDTGGDGSEEGVGDTCGQEESGTD